MPLQRRITDSGAGVPSGRVPDKFDEHYGITVCYSAVRDITEKHFHLYAWMKEAVGDRCAVSPEFPSGSGRVDLYLRCGERRGVIEVKSFRSRSKTEAAKDQAVKYARQMGLSEITVALFAPVEDETVLKELSGGQIIDGIKVTVAAIAWGFQNPAGLNIKSYAVELCQTQITPEFFKANA